MVFGHYVVGVLLSVPAFFVNLADVPELYPFAVFLPAYEVDNCRSVLREVYRLVIEAVSSVGFPPCVPLFSCVFGFFSGHVVIFAVSELVPFFSVDDFQMIVPDCPFPIFFRNPANHQRGYVVAQVVVTAAVIKVNPDAVVPFYEVNLCGLSLAPVHAAGVDGVAHRNVTYNFKREFFVDVGSFHFRFSFLLLFFRLVVSVFHLTVTQCNMPVALSRVFVKIFLDNVKNKFDIVYCLWYYYHEEGGEDVTARQVIEMALAYKGMNKTELASQLGWTKQILAARMDTGKFTLEEWAAISQAIGAKIDFVLKFEDGHKVIITE